MERLVLKVVDPSGLHARPAARFIQVASRFSSRVVIRQGERSADAKSLIALLGLTIRPGSEITLEADGPDAAEAIATLTAELAPYAAPPGIGAGTQAIAPTEP